MNINDLIRPQLQTDRLQNSKDMLRTIEGLAGADPLDSLFQALSPLNPTATSPQASQTHWTQQTQHIQELLRTYIPQLGPRQEMSMALYTLSSRDPDSLTMLSEIFQALPRNHTETPEAIRWLLQEAAQWFSSSPINTQSMTPAEEMMARVGSWRQELVALRDLVSVVTNQSRESVLDMLSYLRFTQKETPSRLPGLLWSLPIHLEAGLSLDEHVLASHFISPEKLAGLILGSQNPLPDGMSLHAPRDGVKVWIQSLRDILAKVPPQEMKKEIAALVETWSQSISSPLKTLNPNTKDLHFPGEGLLSVKEGGTALMALIPYEAKTGFLTQAPLQLLPSNYQVCLQGSLFATQQLASGFHRIEVRSASSGDKGDLSLANLLFYVMSVEEEEEEKEKQKKKEKDPQEFIPQRKQGNPYESMMAQQSNSQQPVPVERILGKLEMSLNRPRLIMTPIEGKGVEPLSAPLHVEFRFLADIVSPDTRWSRSQFLSLPQSEKVQKFRRSVMELMKTGEKAWDGFEKTLGELFDSLRDMIPYGRETFDAVREKFRSLAWHYIQEDPSMAEDLRTQIQSVDQTLELSDRGDILASISVGVSELLEDSEQLSSALLTLVDAYEIGKKKPAYQARLSQFLDRVRQTYLGQKDDSEGRVSFSQETLALLAGSVSAPS